MKRQRGRGRSRPASGNRSYESNGPDVKIRGTSSQIYDKYTQYARDAQMSGDRVKAENYLQHAEHYYRLIAAATPQRTASPPEEDGAISPEEDPEEAPSSPAPARSEDSNYNRRPRRSPGSSRAEAASDRPRRSKPSALDALAAEQATISSRHRD